MGTRGAYGFRINDRDEVTYNHFDSYPEGLGRNVLEYIAHTSPTRMRRAANRIILVSQDSKPTPELIEKYSELADLGVSRRTLAEWYCLLRKAQGNLFPYNQNLRHMIDSHAFLADSLFCEWAYIINLDNNQFEVYRGFNQDPKAPGRYASQSISNSNGYYGVALIREVPLGGIWASSIDELVQQLEVSGAGVC